MQYGKQYDKKNNGFKDKYCEHFQRGKSQQTQKSIH